MSAQAAAQTTRETRTGVGRTLGCLFAHVPDLVPGLLLCLVVTGAAMGLERAEAAAFGATWLEALVLAILVGTAVRTAWLPGRRWLPGITFSAKTLLEVAVLLLGASISARMIMAAGPVLIAGIAGIVVVGDRRQLRHRPGATPATPHGASRGVRQLHLRQLGHRGGGAHYRRGW